MLWGGRRAEGYTRGALNERVAGQAAYLRGDLFLLRGELGHAEEAYREASRRGREPQPGLALCASSRATARRRRPR